MSQEISDEKKPAICGSGCCKKNSRYKGSEIEINSACLKNGQKAGVTELSFEELKGVSQTWRWNYTFNQKREIYLKSSNGP